MMMIYSRRIRCCAIKVWNMAGSEVFHAVLTGPSVVKEIIIATGLDMAAGTLWKMHHWNEQRKVRAFYAILKKDYRCRVSPLPCSEDGFFDVPRLEAESGQRRGTLVHCLQLGCFSDL